MQTREVHAGEGYGITNSFTMHFGLGNTTTVDSLVVHWPCGHREEYSGMSTDTTLMITEGGCMTYLMDLQGPFTQCLVDQFAIDAPDGFTSYLWNTGDTTQEISVVDPGIYHVSMTDAEGCIWLAGPAIVSPANQVEPSAISVGVAGPTATCAGDTIRLSGPDDALAYAWSTGDTTQSIWATSSGLFSVQAVFTCKTLSSDTVTLQVFDPNDFSVANDTVFEAGSGMFMTTGDSILWYDNMGGDPVAYGPEYMTPSVDTTTTYYVQHVDVIPGEHYTVGQHDHTGNTLYNSNTANGALRFDVLNRFHLDSVLVITGFPGTRSILIIDENTDTIYKQSFAIDSGRTYLPLNVWLDPGIDYLMTTDRDTNQAVLGGGSPRLYRSDGGFIYPFTVPDVVSLTGTQSSQQFYYYFYDWHVSLDDRYCEGDLIPVQVVVVDTTTATQHLNLTPLTIDPNPAGTYVRLNGGEIIPETAVMMLFDAEGRQVGGWQADRASGRLMIANLPQGLYVIRTETAGHTYVGKFMKM